MVGVERSKTLYFNMPNNILLNNFEKHFKTLNNVSKIRLYGMYFFFLKMIKNNGKMYWS